MPTSSTPVTRLAIVAAMIGVVGACSSNNNSPAGPNVSLAGNYTLQDFKEAGQDIMQAESTGTAVLTATTYKVSITFHAASQTPAIIDSGTYAATGSSALGSINETSLVTGTQSTGTYTLASNVFTVNVSSQGVAIVQVWQKQ